MGENIIMSLSPMIIHANPIVDQGKRVLPWGIWRTSFNADDRGPPPPLLGKVQGGGLLPLVRSTSSSYLLLRGLAVGVGVWGYFPTAFGSTSHLGGPLGGTPASVRAGRTSDRVRRTSDKVWRTSDRAQLSSEAALGGKEYLLIMKGVGGEG